MQTGTEDVIIEKVMLAINGDALSYQQWNGFLNGTLVSVPANGQCLF